MNKNISIEDVKNFWNKRPCNIRHSTKEIGSKEYFYEVQKRRYFVEPHIKEFLDFDKWKGKNVLDLGCGIGTDAISFALAGANVDAIDISEKSLKIARKMIESWGLYNIRLLQWDLELLNTFLTNHYDLIYSIGVIHHTLNPDNVIQNIWRYAHKDTIIKILLYHKYSWKALWILFIYGKFKFWDWKNLIREYSEAQTGSPITNTYSVREIKKMFSNFDILDIKIRHIFPYKIEEYKKYQYKKYWYFRTMPKWMFNIMQRIFGWHILITVKRK